MVKIWDVTLPELTGEEKRRAYVYVPDIAWSDAHLRFPVLYMFDGHNLFNDSEASYGKSWGMLKYLTQTATPLIVAAIECNHHPEDDPCGGRLSEYSPFDFSYAGAGDIKGRGKQTMDYYTHVFKPMIDREFPTLPDREHTFLSGSSMGGLMTVYGLMAYNEVFGRGAALSPALHFSYPQIKEMIRSANLAPTVLYMDVGSTEIADLQIRRCCAQAVGDLIEKGVWLDCRIIPNGEHFEATWEKQIPIFMKTLFYDL